MGKRCIAENGRITNILKEKNCSKILDVATGTGFHSLNLIRDGFNVVSIDGSINMLDIAKNADLMGLTLDSQNMIGDLYLKVILIALTQLYV